MTREQRLAEAFVELADTLVAPFDLIDFMHTLADKCVDLMSADAAGIMLADQRGQLRVVASSTESARILEVFELQNSEGPCLECFTSGEQVVNVGQQQMRDRWPAFTPAAERMGFQSTHALPLRLRDTTIGALNLFTQEIAVLGETDITVGQALADVATIGLLQERAGRQKEVVAEQLQSALNSRVIIEQAKGVLAERTQISPDEAFIDLRSFARREGRPLTEVASAVLANTLQISAVISP